MKIIFLHFSPKLCFCCKQFSRFLKIVIIMRMMVPNIFRKLRVGLTGLDIKLRKLIQSIPIYHFSVYNTWIKVRYDLVRQLLSSFAGLVDSVVTVLQLYLRLTVDFVAPEYTILRFDIASTHFPLWFWWSCNFMEKMLEEEYTKLVPSCLKYVYCRAEQPLYLHLCAFFYELHA